MVNGEGIFVCVWGGDGDMWEASVASTQFSFESKIALRNKIKFFLKNYGNST